LIGSRREVLGYGTQAASQSDAGTRAHSKADAKIERTRYFSHEVLWSAMRPRIAFAGAHATGRMKETPETKIEILRGDITKLTVNAIVNAANTTLLGGGGVDGAIHRAAGPELLAECRTLGGCRPGEAKMTRGYRLLAGFVIHTVGPIWRGGKHGEARILANCYHNSLQLALENEIKTIAFPAISCGAYGYPAEDAAKIAFKTTRDFLAANDEIQKVIFAVWGEDVYEAYHRLL
jgi:O-acetyl-ADP-ribose deacetylase (regulator of RNase III)